MIRSGICSVASRQLPVDKVVSISSGAELGCMERGADIHVPPGTTHAAGVVRDDPALIPREARTLAGPIRAAAV
jgi:hypothetical protein